MQPKELADDRINYRDPNKPALEKIQGRLGHESLSVTLRQATAEYIARHLHLLRKTG